jgi:hypothetical protein
MIVFLARGILVSLFILEFRQNVSLGAKPQQVYDGGPVCTGLYVLAVRFVLGSYGCLILVLLMGV